MTPMSSTTLPSKYVLMLSAARLIREGVPAGQAAAECGFNDYSAFSRAFRETFGVSPGQLKK